ncbi:antitoxin [Aureimonas endophytica]|uniref:Antitoxin n=1 Tax=Aureimonas endophytica TaxID=2027858 RepID=A0A916ZPR4_9HYPH|nr:type II toxin-antitoxin system Phd/YefM family antitoxin [Aureimonas endophytica]GGE08132.1 antitoxin [Aureimonas endophytica]
MTVHRMTSRAFGENLVQAKEAAKEGPVFIDEEGQATHVLLSVEVYNKLRRSRTLLEMAERWNGGDFDFDPPKLDFRSKPADLD